MGCNLRYFCEGKRWYLHAVSYMKNAKCMEV